MMRPIIIIIIIVIHHPSSTIYFSLFGIHGTVLNPLFAASLCSPISAPIVKLTWGPPASLGSVPLGVKTNQCTR